MIHNPMISGKKLPTLTNPAGAANIQTGYEAIDGNGEKIVGLHDFDITPLFGKVVISNDTTTEVNIPVSRLCTECVFFPISLVTFNFSDIYNNGYLYQIMCSTRLVSQSATKPENKYFQSYLTATDETSGKIVSTVINQSSGALSEDIAFTENNICVKAYVEEYGITAFKRGTYMYIAW